MEELLSQLTTAVKGMWKYRWPGVVAAWIVAIAGAIVVWKLPDRYEADARVFVDTQSILKPLMSGLAVQPNVDQQVAMLGRTLISRPNVEKLVRMADLDLSAATPPQQEARIEELTRALEIRSTGRDNLFTLSYRDSDPEKAKRVIQSLVSIFVESSLGATRKDTDAAKVFIDEQIKGYQVKLEEAEARLKAFRLRNMELQTKDGVDVASRLAELSGQLDKARIELREAENARDAAKAGLASQKAESASLAKSLMDELPMAVSTPEVDSRLDAQKKRLDALLQRYTDEHPEVVATRRIIKDLEEQKGTEVAELKRSAHSASASSFGRPDDLATQELRKVLASAEVQVAALRARVSEYSARYERAFARVKSYPEIEAEAAQLNRDYGIHKKNYEDLVSRREAASMSGDLEVASGNADFRLIDPPRVSPKPVWPNRLLLMPLVLIAALGVGLFIPFAVSQLRPAFHNTNELRSKVALPLLGVVSLVVSETDARRERTDRMRFWVASSALVGIFAVGLTAMAIVAQP